MFLWPYWWASWYLPEAKAAIPIRIRNISGSDSLPDYAFIYDITGQSTFRRQQAENMLAWLRACEWEPNAQATHRVLDLACSTGEAVCAFAAAGYHVTGVDCSAAMLERAHNKTQQAGLEVRLLQRDTHKLTPTLNGVDTSTHLPPHAFDLVTCLDGSLNELLERQHLQQVCMAAALFLRPGGLFVFDLIPEAELSAQDEHDRLLYDSPSILVYNRHTCNVQQRIMTERTVWFHKEEQHWQRYEEIRLKRAWRNEDIAQALAHAHLAQRSTGPCQPKGFVIATHG